jgi:hypothetical protein
MTYATPEAIRAALLETHERTLSDPATLAVFGGPVLIRELTAGQRLRAAAAARAENPDEPDMALFDAIRLHLCVVDPASGTPYADGRTDDAGRPLIDPRTRVPIFSGDDVLALAEGRSAVAALLLDAIDDLSALRPVHLQGRHAAPDGGERDARGGRARIGGTPGADANGGSGAPDERVAVGAAAGGAGGPEPGAVGAGNVE